MSITDEARDDLPDALPGWIVHQRWYGGKGSEPNLERIGGWSVAAGDATVHTHYLLDRGPTTTTLYQVPITERTVPLADRQPIPDSAGRYFYDAPHDPAYPAALLDLMIREDAAGTDQDVARGHRQPGTTLVEVVDSSVLSGEQSNTSIICSVQDSEGEPAAPVIIKVFRALHHGDNPDVVLQSAIAAAGSHAVPASVGFLSGQWRDVARPDGIASGHLAFAQEFLPGVQDAWRVALRAAESSTDFSTEARDLGVATAEVHGILKRIFPERATTEADRTQFLRGMSARLDAAIAAVPEVARYRAPIEAVFEAARETTWPDLQRIHGDYHLGQVLSVAGRGWVLVDFEGEPLRAMTERSEPDVPLRDVAGMLRSFDYAAGTILLTAPSGDAVHWAASARNAFLDGYVSGSDYDVRDHRQLLDAFELDKALYEVVYEARNRPDWIEIPLAAIRRLVDSEASSQD